MKIFLSHKSRSSAIINHFSESAIGTFQFLLANGCFHEWDRLNSLLGANPKWINLRDKVRCTPETAADKTIDHDPDYFVSPKAARSQEKKTDISVLSRIAAQLDEIGCSRRSTG